MDHDRRARRTSAIDVFYARWQRTVDRHWTPSRIGDHRIGPLAFNAGHSGPGELVGSKDGIERLC
jgi:hypothetical protein